VLQAEPAGETGDLAGDVGRVHGCDERSGGVQRVDPALGEAEPPGPPVDLGVDDQVRQRPGTAGEHRPQRGRAAVTQDLGRVVAGREDRRHGRGRAGERGEQVVGPDRRAAPGLVGVERDQDAGLRQAGRPVQGRDLGGGQGRAAGRDGRVPVTSGGRDGDRVERAFHDHRHRSGGERAAALPQPEQRLALVVQHGARAVQVPRDGRAAMTGRAAGEGDDGAAGGPDGEHGAVAEGVGQRAAPGPAGEPGSLDQRVRVAAGPQVTGERIPPAGAYPTCQRRQMSGPSPRPAR